jgi:Na+/H+-dicarboxylate symporter
MKKIGLLPRLIIGIIMGIAIGLLSAQAGRFEVVRILSTFSSIFGNFLKFIIPFIIVGFVAPGIADLGNKAGKLLGITAVFAYVSAVLAGLMAFFVGSTILPNFIKIGEEAAGNGADVSAFFTIEMPPAMGVMTALVTAFVIGLGMAVLKEKNLLGVIKDFQSIVMLVVNNVLIPCIPIYIAGVFTKLSATGKIFDTIKGFSSVFAMILILQVVYLIIQYTLAWAITGKNPVKAIKNLLPAYFTALGTQSSAATIPVSLEASRKNGVDDDIVDFVVPLCATIHLAGDTITLVLGAMGIMMVSGTVPGLQEIVPYILMLGVTMVAAPGIPGGGVYAALGLLENMLGFAGPQQALMIALHFSQDSFGTATNVTGDGAIAIIMNYVNSKMNAKSEKVKKTA